MGLSVELYLWCRIITQQDQARRSHRQSLQSHAQASLYSLLPLVSHRPHSPATKTQQHTCDVLPREAPLRLSDEGVYWCWSCRHPQPSICPNFRLSEGKPGLTMNRLFAQSRKSRHTYHSRNSSSARFPDVSQQPAKSASRSSQSYQPQVCNADPFSHTAHTLQTAVHPALNLTGLVHTHGTSQSR